jgi:glucose/arabinose dehydrogenase
VNTCVASLARVTRARLAALAALVGTLAAGAVFISESNGEQQQLRLRLQPVASGFSALTHAAAPRNEPGRLYVVEQDGRIHVLVNGRRRATPFLDIRSLVTSGGEQGLFSIAFHPNYQRNRRFYVQYTGKNGETRVIEYRSNGVRALPGTRRQIFFSPDPYGNHNAGQLAFGPDGRLYFSMGDGGSGGDPENRAQNLSSLFGKLLAVNVDRRGARPQIVGYGLRNPWRFSFDRATGDLYIGDVGQNAWEEIDYTPRRSSGLENYGWDVFEGRAGHESKEPNSAGRLVFPIVVLPNPPNQSVIGGFVYRGRALASLRGRFFYGDAYSSQIWSLRVRGGRATSVRQEPFEVSGLSSFGEDAAGELYAVSLEGRVFKLVGA